MTPIAHGQAGTETSRLRRQIAREQSARIEAESIAESVTRDLYEKNQALIVREAVSRALVERASEALFVCDATGTVIDVNELACASLLYERSELLGLNLDRICGIDGLMTPEVQDRIDAGLSLALDRDARRSNDTTFPARLNLSQFTVGTQRYVLCSVRDVSEARRVEQHARRIESRMASIVSGIVDGVVVFDSDGVVHASNPAADRLFGCEGTTLLGVHMNELIPQARGVAPDGMIGDAREMTGVRKGVTFPLEMSCARLGDEFVAIVRDVSRRKEVERLKAQFLSAVSHELRTPIASIRGALDLVACGALGAVPQGFNEAIAIAQRNGVRLQHLIDDLLDHQRLELGRLRFDMQVVSIGETVRRTVASLAVVADHKGITLQHEIEDAQVAMDAERIEQVLGNLIGNALKFSQRGSSIWVRVLRSGSMMRIEVTDSGRGIPQTHLGSIFMPFQQVEGSDARREGGTGLGLAICKAIVEQHGGRIGVESDFGRGSTFWFELPCGE